MEKQIINPETLAKPFGYSHGIATSGGQMLFLAGQPALDASGKIVALGDMAAQFTQAVSNLRTVIVAAGGAMTDIVKLTIYVTDVAAYKANLKPIGAAYRDFFGKYYPTTTLVEVKSLFDDGAMIEMDGIAVVDK